MPPMCGQISSMKARRLEVAKATILICDLCKTQEPAKDTLTLKRGRGTSVALDLCQRHIKEVVAVFKPARLVSNNKPPRSWNKADYDTVCAKAMELAETRPLFTGADLMVVAGIKSAVAHRAINMLIKDGKITSTGENRSRKLSKAS
jgi:hypothetical protein